MEQLFYFKKYETPITYTDKLTGKELSKTGEYICNHPEVEKAWCTGGISLSGDGTMEMYTNLIMKDGSRKEFLGDFDYFQINQFLNSIQK